MRSIRFAVIAALLAVFRLPAQTTPTAFLTTAGKDTFCFEQFTRTANVVTGTWVVMHPPGVFVHDYRITLSNDGIPVRYEMLYSTPGAPELPQLDSLIVTYERDTANILFKGRDSSFTRRLAMRDAFPLLGQSFVGVELALMRLRRMHVDSATITLHPPTQPASPITVAPIRFLSSDTAMMRTLRMHIAPDGRVLDFREGSLEFRRVAPLDVRALTNAFVNEFAPRRAALAAAAAARVEIAVPAAQLEKFVGTYVLSANTVSITRDGDHLTIHFPQQQPMQLLASSQTEFFVRKPDLVVTFDLDAKGSVTGLAIGTGDMRQRLNRVLTPPARPNRGGAG